MTPERGLTTTRSSGRQSQPRRGWRRFLLWTLLAGLILVLGATLPAVWVYLVGQGGIYDSATEAPPVPVAIVFGAGLQADGSPSWMLADLSLIHI